MSGEDWPSLSKKYKQKKIDDGLPGVPNMEYEGDMLDSLSYKPADNGIELGVFGKDAWKADGHLKFSGEDNNTPQRRFIPGEDQKFIKSIQSEAEQIIATAIAEETEIDTEDLDSVNNRAELYDVLEDYFSGLSRAEIREAIFSSPSLADLLAEYDLLRFL